MFFSNYSNWLIGLASVGIITSCSYLDSSNDSVIQVSNNTSPITQTIPQQWRAMTEEEVNQAWQYILNSPLGIAALNQLAIEGFISPNCPKSFYVNEETGGFQTLLQVECPSPRGTSIARGYDEIRVIFNRFEDNIESFEIERISSEE